MPYEILIPTLGFAAVGFVVSLLVWRLLQRPRSSQAAPAPAPIQQAVEPVAHSAPHPSAQPAQDPPALARQDPPALARIEHTLSLMADAQATLMTRAEEPSPPPPPPESTVGAEDLRGLLSELQVRLSEPTGAEQVLAEVRAALTELPDMIAAQLAERQARDEARQRRLMSDISSTLAHQTTKLEGALTDKLADALPRLDTQATLGAQLSAQTESIERHAAASARLEQQLATLSGRLSAPTPAAQGAQSDPESSAPQSTAARRNPAPSLPMTAPSVAPNPAPTPTTPATAAPVTLRPWLRAPAPRTGSASPVVDTPPRPRSAPQDAAVSHPPPAQRHSQ